MKNRCRELGKVSLANRLAGCGNIHVGCAALRARRVRKGNGAATNQKSKPPTKAKSSRFDSLVARYYPAVYGVASRLTDPEPPRRGRACVNPDIRCNPGGSHRRLSRAHVMLA